MTDGERKGFTIFEMLELVNTDKEDKILNIVYSIESPFEALCTLALAMSKTLASIHPQVEDAHHNLDGLNTFMKTMITMYIKHEDLDEDRTIN